MRLVSHQQRLRPLLPCFFVSPKVSGLTDSLQLIHLEADLCKTRDSALAANLNLMRNITK